MEKGETSSRRRRRC